MSQIFIYRLSKHKSSSPLGPNLVCWEPWKNLLIILTSGHTLRWYYAMWFFNGIVKKSCRIGRVQRICMMYLSQCLCINTESNLALNFDLNSFCRWLPVQQKHNADKILLASYPFVALILTWIIHWLVKDLFKVGPELKKKSLSFIILLSFFLFSFYLR